jgi:hypothetical protein
MNKLVGYIVLILIALYLIFEFWVFILFFGIVVGGFYIWNKNRKKKKLEASLNWIPDHIDELEAKAKSKLAKAAALQKALIEADHYVTKLPNKEKSTVYHTLDERKEYLEQVETLLADTHNRIVIERFPFIAPAADRWGIDSTLNLFKDMLHSLWMGNDQTPLADYPAEKAMFLQNGVDLEYLAQVREYKMEEFENFYYSVIYRNPKEDDSIKIEQKIINAGLAGEKRLEQELDMYKDVWNPLYNVRLEVDGNSVESDAIIVCAKGIFTLEAKNFSSSGSYQIRITKDGQWQKVFSSGKVEPMKDVVSQANRHVAFKQRFINDSLQKKGISEDYIPVQSIIVIANDNVIIENESDSPVIRISQIYNFIQKQPVTLTSNLVDEITKLLKENTLPAKPFPHRSYEKELEQWLEFLIPSVEYSYQAGLAHADYIQAIGKGNPTLLKNYISQHDINDLGFPLSADLELARNYMQKYV